MEKEEEPKLYGCAVTRMRKTKAIRNALKLKGLTDEQIKYAKVWRFSNRVYTEDNSKALSSSPNCQKISEIMSCFFKNEA